MSRYIEFNDAVKVMACEMYAEAQSQGYDVDGIEDFMPEAKAWLNDAPSIDIEPKRGEWTGYNADKGDDWLRSDGEPIFLVCNKCYGTVMNNTSAHWNFCPNCGADMREREGE